MNTVNNVKGKKVLIKMNFNVPLDEELNIIDDTRITAALPTIKKLSIMAGIAIIISHLGRQNKDMKKIFFKECCWSPFRINKHCCVFLL